MNYFKHYFPIFNFLLWALFAVYSALTLGDVNLKIAANILLLVLASLALLIAYGLFRKNKFSKKIAIFVLSIGILIDLLRLGFLVFITTISGSESGFYLNNQYLAIAVSLSLSILSMYGLLSPNKAV